MPEIGAVLDEKNERTYFLEKRPGFAEESLRKANEARKVAENLAEEARLKVAETDGSCTYSNIKAVQLSTQGERIKAECKKHKAKVEDMCAAHERAEPLVSSKEEEVVRRRHHAADELQEAQVNADGLASEIEAACQTVKVGEKEMTAAASKYEADAKDLRSALERVKTSVAANKKENRQPAAASRGRAPGSSD